MCVARLARQVPVLMTAVLPVVQVGGIGALMQQEEIDGALVGGASLKSADFLPIVDAAGQS